MATGGGKRVSLPPGGCCRVVCVCLCDEGVLWFSTGDPCTPCLPPGFTQRPYIRETVHSALYL